jgi:hypothetical protein
VGGKIGGGRRARKTALMVFGTYQRNRWRISRAASRALCRAARCSSRMAARISAKSLRRASPRSRAACTLSPRASDRARCASLRASGRSWRAVCRASWRSCRNSRRSSKLSRRASALSRRASARSSNQRVCPAAQAISKSNEIASFTAGPFNTYTGGAGFGYESFCTVDARDPEATPLKRNIRMRGLAYRRARWQMADCGSQSVSAGTPTRC